MEGGRTRQTCERNAKRREARDAGVQAVLSIEAFLFQDQSGNPRSEYEIEEFLIELRARIEIENLQGTLAMIYPKDEPFRNFVDQRDPNFIEKHITGEVYDEIYADLSLVNYLVKLVFPEVPIGVILSGYSLHNRFFSIPENYDWIGFDCYKNLFASCDNRSFVEQYRHLLDHMQPHQSLMAVPEALSLVENVERADWPDILLQRLRHHYEIALNEPRFVAFVPFIWSLEQAEPKPELGLKDFPENYDDGVSNKGSVLVEQMARIGLEIKEQSAGLPNMAWAETEAVRSRPPSNIRGEIMGITREGVISAWAFNDALPHKNLRVQVMVRDDRGKLLHKSKPERTFVNDPSLARPDRIGQEFTGLHGFRYQIPSQIFTRNKGRTLSVEFIIYADGTPAQVGHVYHYQIDRNRKRIPRAGFN